MEEDWEFMQYNRLCEFQRYNASWKLLSSPYASFIAAFLYKVFIADGQRSISEEVFLNYLNDYIEDRNAELKREEKPFRSARVYLEMWADSEHSWLRRFYLRDEPYVDLTSAAQKAITWLTDLRQKKFIGTESRLRTVFDLLHQIADETDTDPDNRLAALENEKQRIEEKIRQLKSGVPLETMSDLQIKERYLQAAQLSKDILADFREVEENFRQLERDMRDKIVTWTQGKGALLDEVFTAKDSIAESDQGRSFEAFWKFLMMPVQQEDFRTTVRRVEAAGGAAAKVDLTGIHNEWMKAANSVQQTIAALSKQLRRYVDQSFLAEERRMFMLIQSIEKQAVDIREKLPKGDFMELDSIRAELALPMDRPLFVPPQRVRLAEASVEEGSEAVSVAALFEQVYVDAEVLKKRVDSLLIKHETVTLAEVVKVYPLRKGLTELVGYLVLASHLPEEDFTQQTMEQIVMKDPSGRQLLATLQKITFCRKPAKVKKGQR